MQSLLTGLPEAVCSVCLLCPVRWQGFSPGLSSLPHCSRQNQWKLLYLCQAPLPLCKCANISSHNLQPFLDAQQPFSLTDISTEQMLRQTCPSGPLRFLSGSVERANSEFKDWLSQEINRGKDGEDWSWIMCTDCYPTNMLEKLTLKAIHVRCKLSSSLANHLYIICFPLDSITPDQPSTSTVIILYSLVAISDIHSTFQMLTL